MAYALLRLAARRLPVNNLAVALASFQSGAISWLRDGTALFCAFAGLVLLAMAAFWLCKTSHRGFCLWDADDGAPEEPDDPAGDL